jgi:vitamin K-dependent gamma-carboxylase
MRWLFRPIDVAALAVFRITFGILMLIAVLRYFVHGWIEQFYLEPRLFFPYPGLEWIIPLPATGMYALYLGLGLCAVAIAAGWRYRLTTLLFCTGFTYAHLIDRTVYLNHYYLVSLLSGLMVVLPLHRAWSLDARRWPAWRRATVPAWSLWLLRLQLAVVYVFGGIAKLNPDWLVRAEPLRIWLPANSHLPLLGPWLELPWVAYAFSYAGLLFDLTIVALLLWKRSRPAAYAAVLVFHILTALLFPIGMFPWIMIALTPIFFPPDWPRHLPMIAAGRERRSSPVILHTNTRLTPRRMLGLAAATVYTCLQILVPLRHLRSDGNLYWTEDGFRFAWQIMVMEKHGQARFRIVPPGADVTTVVAPRDWLTLLQTRMMATQPDMILSFAHALADRYGAPRPAVYADIYVSLNGRPHRRFIDPAVDLAALPSDAPVSRFVLPLQPDDNVSTRSANLDQALLIEHEGP